MLTDSIAMNQNISVNQSRNLTGDCVIELTNEKREKTDNSKHRKKCIVLQS